MAIVLDTKTDPGATVGSWSHTCSGSDRLLVLIFTVNDSEGGISGATYAGAALTRGITFAGGTDLDGVEIWYKIAPATGSNTLAISGLPVSSDYHAYSASFTGVQQTSPLDDSDSASGNSATPSVTSTPTTDGQLIIGGLSSETNNAPSTGAGETTGFNSDNGAWASSFEYAIQTSKVAQAINWGITSDLWGCAAVSFKASSNTGNFFYFLY